MLHQSRIYLLSCLAIKCFFPFLVLVILLFYKIFSPYYKRNIHPLWGFWRIQKNSQMKITVLPFRKIMAAINVTIIFNTVLSFWITSVCFVFLFTYFYFTSFFNHNWHSVPFHSDFRCGQKTMQSTEQSSTAPNTYLASPSITLTLLTTFPISVVILQVLICTA